MSTGRYRIDLNAPANTKKQDVMLSTIIDVVNGASIDDLFSVLGTLTANFFVDLFEEDAVEAYRSFAFSVLETIQQRLDGTGEPIVKN